MTVLKYWLRLAELFRHYRKRSIHLPYFPIRLWIELTSVCNYRCIMCPNKDLPKNDRGFMDFDLFKKVIDEAAGFAFDVNLAHRGESLLHPQLIDMITYSKRKSLFTRLHTNGSLLTENLSRQIVLSGLDRLSFSFDGYEKETYERIRKGGDFEKTVGNIVRFLKVKKALRSKKPVTAVEVIDFKEGRRDLKAARTAFLNRFRGLPIDSLVIKELHNWAGEINKESPPARYAVCTFPWNALVIFWDGAVLPCTQDFFGHYVVGNAGESPLKDIWNNTRMTELRKMLSSGSISGLKTCSNCDRLKRKGFLGVPTEYLWKFLAKKMP